MTGNALASPKCPVSDRFRADSQRPGWQPGRAHHLARAAFYIEKFVSLWENAYPALQPRVSEARARLQGLVAHPQ